MYSQVQEMNTSAVCYRFASIPDGVFSTLSETRKKKSSMCKPSGYKKRVGGGVWRDCRGEQVKEKSSFACHLYRPLAALPISQHHLASGGSNNCSWWGGKCSLCSFSVPLGVLPTHTTLAISCASHSQDFHIETQTHTYSTASKPTSLSALPLIFLCGALCSCCALAWCGEKGEQSSGRKLGWRKERLDEWRQG